MNRPTFSEPNPNPSTKAVEATDGAMNGNDDLNPEQRAGVVKALFLPSVRRMQTIVTTVVQTSQNADMALWVPLAAMDTVMHDLEWTGAPPAARQKFLGLISLTLKRYHTNINAHLNAVTAWEAGGRVGPSPTYPVWVDNDTLEVYDEAERMFGTAVLSIVDRGNLRDLLLMIIDTTDLPGGNLAANATREEVEAADKALMDVIAGWTDDEARTVEVWVNAIMMQASGDHPNVVVPPWPAIIPKAKAAEEPPAE